MPKKKSTTPGEDLVNKVFPQPFIREVASQYGFNMNTCLMLLANICEQKPTPQAKKAKKVATAKKPAAKNVPKPSKKPAEETSKNPVAQNRHAAPTKNSNKGCGNVPFTNKPSAPKPVVTKPSSKTVSKNVQLLNYQNSSQLRKSSSSSPTVPPSLPAYAPGFASTYTRAVNNSVDSSSPSTAENSYQHQYRQFWHDKVNSAYSIFNTGTRNVQPAAGQNTTAQTASIPSLFASGVVPKPAAGQNTTAQTASIPSLFDSGVISKPDTKQPGPVKLTPSDPKPIVAIKTTDKSNETNQTKLQPHNTPVEPVNASESFAFSELLKKSPINSTNAERIDHAIELINLKLKVLVILRGVSGSGKSTLAESIYKQTVDLPENNRAYHIYSTDNYFCHRSTGVYNFDASRLSEAHAWNQKRSFDGMSRGISPIIIDNTNIQYFEMHPYIIAAIRFGYAIELLEPATTWAKKASQCALKSIHNVAKEKIAEKLDLFQSFTAEQLLGMLNLHVDYRVRLRNYPPCYPPINFKEVSDYLGIVGCSVNVRTTTPNGDTLTAIDETNVNGANEVADSENTNDINLEQSAPLSKAQKKKKKLKEKLTLELELNEVGGNNIEEKTDENEIMSDDTVPLISLSPLPASNLQPNVESSLKENYTDDEMINLLGYSSSKQDSSTDDLLRNLLSKLSFKAQSPKNSLVFKRKMGPNEVSLVKKFINQTNQVAENTNENRSQKLKYTNDEMINLIRDPAFKQRIESGRVLFDKPQKIKQLPRFCCIQTQEDVSSPKKIVQPACTNEETTKRILTSLTLNSSTENLEIIDQPSDEMSTNFSGDLINFDDENIEDNLNVRPTTSIDDSSLVDGLEMNESLKPSSDVFKQMGAIRKNIDILSNMFPYFTEERLCKRLVMYNSMDAVIDSLLTCPNDDDDNGMDDNDDSEDEDQETVEYSELIEVENEKKDEIQSIIVEERDGPSLILNESINHAQCPIPLSPDFSEDSGWDEVVQVDLGEPLVTALEQLFGSPAALCFSKNASSLKRPNTTVQLPVLLAKQLHAIWVESAHLPSQTQRTVCDATAQDTVLSDEFEQDLQKLSADQSCQNNHIDDFQEFFDMEMSLQIARNERKIWNDAAIAQLERHIKMRKLTELFPGYDPDILSELVATHDFATLISILSEANGSEPADHFAALFEQQTELLHEIRQINENKNKNEQPKTYKRAIDSVASASTSCTSPAPLCSTSIGSQTLHCPMPNYSSPSRASPSITPRSTPQTNVDYREQADQELRMHREMAAKALSYYNRRIPEVASYYTELANCHKRRYDELNACAVKEHVESLGDERDTLDMHQMLVKEAITALDVFIDIRINNLKENSLKGMSVYVVTGRGLNSPGGQSRLKPAVLKRLKERHLGYRFINDGFLKIKLNSMDVLSTDI